ncbi:hypothetical protein JMJ55_28765 [Belnapia sp. T6]|uniref:Mobilization protein n=1 Tax=Belnapia mucosa TaxID=2804532 RepID=A0ABS1VCC2_9PROT|nr:hypothetical protein [Belnapia mucosa]MBL6459316.1 hypothetical protein [Belnapia mucosa]
MSDVVLDKKAAAAAERQARAEEARQRRAEEAARFAEEQRALGRVRVGGWIQPERKDEAEAMLRRMLEGEVLASGPDGRDDRIRQLEQELAAARSEAEHARLLRDELQTAKQAAAELQGRVTQAEARATAAEARTAAAERRATEAARLLEQPGLRGKLGAWLLKG